MIANLTHGFFFIVVVAGSDELVGFLCRLWIITHVNIEGRGGFAVVVLMRCSRIIPSCCKPFGRPHDSVSPSSPCERINRIISHIEFDNVAVATTIVCELREVE
jgi:hypothetical protein